jgi:hypothetical protein
MGGTPTKMAKRDRFIKKKIEEWIQKNGEPEIGEREKLVQRFIDEYFGAIDPTVREQLERNIKLQF